MLLRTETFQYFVCNISQCTKTDDENKVNISLIVDHHYYWVFFDLSNCGISNICLWLNKATISIREYFYSKIKTIYALEKYSLTF